MASCGFKCNEITTKKESFVNWHIHITSVPWKNQIFLFKERGGAIKAGICTNGNIQG